MAAIRRGTTDEPGRRDRTEAPLNRFTPSSPALRRVIPNSVGLNAVDILLAVWVLVWIGLGVAIGIKLSDLSGLSHTAILTGHAVQALGRSFGLLGNVPLVGGAVGGVASQVQAAGANIAGGGANSLSSIHALSVLLAVAVALLPSVPVFGFYLPVRLDMRREARALRQAVLQHGDEPAFRAFLARRAIDAIGYHRLRGVTTLPWAHTGADAETAELAAAELARLGIEPELLDRTSHGRRTDT